MTHPNIRQPSIQTSVNPNHSQNQTEFIRQRQIQEQYERMQAQRQMEDHSLATGSLAGINPDLDEMMRKSNDERSSTDGKSTKSGKGKKKKKQNVIKIE